MRQDTFRRMTGTARTTRRLPSGTVVVLLLAAVATLLAVAGCGWRPRQVSTEQGSQRPAGWSLRSPVLSADGRRLAFEAVRVDGDIFGGIFPSHLLVVDAGTGRLEYHHHEPDVRDSPMQWHRDGVRLLVRRADFRGDPSGDVGRGLFVVDTDDGRVDPVLSGPLVAVEDAQWSPDCETLIFQGTVASDHSNEITHRGVYWIRSGKGLEAARLLRSNASMIAVRADVETGDVRVFTEERAPPYAPRVAPESGSAVYSVWQVDPHAPEDAVCLIQVRGSKEDYPQFQVGNVSKRIAWRHPIPPGVVSITPASDEHTPKLSIYSWDTDRLVTATAPHDLRCRNFSPDDRMLLCTLLRTGRHLSLWICDVDTGEVRELGGLAPERFAGAVWLPEGDAIYLADGDSIWRIGAATGAPELVFRIHEGWQPGETPPGEG